MGAHVKSADPAKFTQEEPGAPSELPPPAATVPPAGADAEAVATEVTSGSGSGSGAGSGSPAATTGFDPWANSAANMRESLPLAFIVIFATLNSSSKIKTDQ